MRRLMLPDAPSDDTLVALACEGSRAAFDRLVKRHFARTYSVLFRLVGNHEDAEDLAQDAFVRVHGSLHRYRASGSFQGWLLRIALHLARDHQRRRGRAPLMSGEELEEVFSSRPGPDGDVDRRELVCGLQAAIERLPDNLRVALVLRVLEGLDYSRVAEATGVRPGTVRTQVMKARRLLERWLAPFLDVEAERGGPGGTR